MAEDLSSLSVPRATAGVYQYRSRRRFHDGAIGYWLEPRSPSPAVLISQRRNLNVGAYNAA
jgi:hypothetical protein